MRQEANEFAVDSYVHLAWRADFGGGKHGENR